MTEDQLPLWPKELPWALLQGYEVQTVDPVERTPLDSGRERERRRYVSVPQDIKVEFIFNRSQSAYFELMFKETLQDGVGYFKAHTRTGRGVLQEILKFNGIYRGPIPVSAALNRYTATLRVFERKTIDPAFIDLPGLVAGWSLIDLTMNRHWPEA